MSPALSTACAIRRDHHGYRAGGPLRESQQGPCGTAEPSRRQGHVSAAWTAALSGRVSDEKYGLVGRSPRESCSRAECDAQRLYPNRLHRGPRGWTPIPLNINCRYRCRKLAEALHAEKLILLTDVRGLLRDPKDEDSLIHVVHDPGGQRLCG